jgi:regulator of protease activity HflC (stomatin/prohibitin superfamily)
MSTRNDDLSEHSFSSFNGYVIALVAIFLLLGAVYFGYGLAMQRPNASVTGFSVCAVLAAFLVFGLFTIQPNEGAVITLFGSYSGTERDSGLRWVVPFYSREMISLRSRNFNSERLKVNDKNGNPIEIGAAVTWRVQDTAKALFEVESYEQYVHIQAEAAIRHLASEYSYDTAGEHEHPGKPIVTLRGGSHVVAKALRDELTERFEKAGVYVEEAKLTHLAYAPEIAGAMLRRQQAEAVIDARSKIVLSAVSMVEMALKGLTERQIVELDNERKAALVSNLLVVLCAESSVQPIVNSSANKG